MENEFDQFKGRKPYDSIGYSEKERERRKRVNKLIELFASSKDLEKQRKERRKQEIKEKIISIVSVLAIIAFLIAIFVVPGLIWGAHAYSFILIILGLIFGGVAGRGEGGCATSIVFVIIAAACFGGAWGIEKAYSATEKQTQEIIDPPVIEDSCTIIGDSISEIEPISTQEEIWLDTYRGHSLHTGATPYQNKYGSNSKSGNARLKVIAPTDCDVLVMIKDDYGRVTKHAYIRAGSNYSFSVKAGIHQPFFIFGNSWCPEKEAPNGEWGYFLENVSISKDFPQKIASYQELQYTLQSVQNGNFHAADSDEDEAF